MASSDPSRRASNPSSTLLHDMLREKKAQTQRVNKTYDTTRSDGRDVQSSPIAAMSTRDRQTSQQRSGSGGVNRNVVIPKEMSMKEMESHLQKSNSKIFDMKLEIYHRDQRIKTLEAEAAEVEVLKEDNKEMQSINEDLLVELELSNEAVREAAGIICEREEEIEGLKAKIEEMGAAEIYFGRPGALSTVPASSVTSSGPEDQSTSPHAGGKSPASRPKPHDGSSSDSPHSRIGARSPNSSQRVPSFLREDNAKTHVLRSLYSRESLVSADDDEEEMDDHNVNSPRLSVLSESGFLEIYGDSRGSDRISSRQTEQSNVSDNPPHREASPRDMQRGARLQKWVEERKRPITPTRTSSKPAVNDHFSSIGEILEKVPSNTKEQDSTEQAPREQRGRQVRSPKKQEQKEIRGHQRRPSSPAFGGPIFGGAVLPPTPGTMSTATIAGNSSTPSIVTEKSLSDGTSILPGGYSGWARGDRPGSSDSDFAHYQSNALNFDDESEDEPGSPPSNKSPKATRISAADTMTRPVLTTSATTTVFSGEGYATTQPSRTLSYPSPTGRARRQTELLSPKSGKSPATIGDRASSRTQQDRRGERSTTTTPTKRGAQEPQARSPPITQTPSTPTTSNPDPQSETDPKLGRSASLRSKITNFSLTPTNPSPHQSVTSRLFRRSTSQSVQLPSNTPPSRPPIARNNSSTRHPRLPRPSSLYGSNPTTTTYGQQSLPNHSANPSPHHHESSLRPDLDPIPPLPLHALNHDHMYKLSPPLPEARPKTAESTGGGRGVPRRYSAVMVDQAWDHQNEQRTDSTSRQTMRATADDNDDETGKNATGGGGPSIRWPLGRSASARIREGFGFKRS